MGSVVETAARTVGAMVGNGSGTTKSAPGGGGVVGVGMGVGVNAGEVEDGVPAGVEMGVGVGVAEGRSRSVVIGAGGLGELTAIAAAAGGSAHAGGLITHPTSANIMSTIHSAANPVWYTFQRRRRREDCTGGVDPRSSLAASEVEAAVRRHVHFSAA